MGKELTARQREILDFIRETIEGKGFPPTIREIGEKFKITSTNGVRAILSALSRKGYIRRKPLVSRGIELAKKARILFDFAQPRPYTTVPLVGRIAAGLPTLAVTAARGDTLVAVLGEAATVTKYVPQKSKVKLEPANPAYRPIVVDRESEAFRIAGKVIGLLRKM
jgi:repressor LexA